MKFFKEIEKFKKWSKDHSGIPEEERGGEWECDFKNWPLIWNEFEIFLQETAFDQWTEDQVNDILYIIARDNECNSIIEMIAENSPVFEFIARKGLKSHSDDTKWQIAELLYKLDDPKKAEELLEKYLDQDIEYVSRMAVKALGALKSALTEKYCEKAWNWDENDPMQQYQRMMSLSVLYEYGSPLTQKYIEFAKQDGREHLLNIAFEIERETGKFEL